MSRRAGIAALTAAAALLYCLQALLDYRRFLTSTFDLVIFDQGVRGYSHFHPPTSIARGVADGQNAHFSLLADHWSPILALLAPLYWIHGSPATLLVAQAVLFALAIPFLWAYTFRRLGSQPAAYFVGGAYALSLPIMAAVVFDFHEVAFVPLLTAIMVERFEAGKHWHGVLAAVALLFVKEDMGLLVAGFGVYLLLTRRPGTSRHWIGLGLVIGGVAATWIATRLLIPAFGGSADFYWAYSQFGSSLGSAALNILGHPLHALHVFFTPWVKTRTMIGLLAMFAFLPLASPMVLAALPLLAERMLASGYPLWWQAKFQYDAFLVMIVCCAAVDGAARLQEYGFEGAWPWRRPAWLRRDGQPWRFGTVWAAAICVAALVYVPSSPFGDLLHPKFYMVNARMRAASAAIAHVPSGVEVEAVNNIGPRLSARDTVLLLDGTPRWAPWVVADTIGLDFPFCTPHQQAQLVTWLLAHGYTQVYADDGYVVLHRPADARTARALVHPVPAANLHTNVCY